MKMKHAPGAEIKHTPGAEKNDAGNKSSVIGPPERMANAQAAK